MVSESKDASPAMKWGMSIVGVGFIVVIAVFLFKGDVDKSGKAIEVEGYRDDCLTPWETSLLLEEANAKNDFDMYKKYSNMAECDYRTMDISGGEIRKGNALAMKEYKKRGYGQ